MRIALGTGPPWFILVSERDGESNRTGHRTAVPQGGGKSADKNLVWCKEGKLERQA